MPEISDNVIPKGQWEFDEEVTSVFDDMLKRSIPDYSDMRSLVFNIGKHYVKIGTAIIDIGCSRGNAIAPFVQTYGDDLKYLLLDCSEPMIQAAKERFGCSNENFQILNYDLKQGVPKTNASLCLSILTLQFTPIEYRHKILKSIYDDLCEGGALIIVEKVLGNTCEIDDTLVSEYYAIKSENAYTNEQIQSKRKSLEGVLVPITARWNEDLLRETGFAQVDCFWRYLNFAGWIAIK